MITRRRGWRDLCRPLQLQIISAADVMLDLSVRNKRDPRDWKGCSGTLREQIAWRGYTGITHERRQGDAAKSDRSPER